MAPARPTVAPNAGAADFSTFHGLAVSGDGNTIALGTGVRATDAATDDVTRTVFVY